MSVGYVYIMSNPAMPGIIKIGRTSVHPTQRASQLFQTGVPLPFNVEEWVFCPDAFMLEAALHMAFEERRVAENREFFRVSVAEAYDAMKDMHLDHLWNEFERYFAGISPEEIRERAEIRKAVHEPQGD